jgi:hypothetical protein
MVDTEMELNKTACGLTESIWIRTENNEEHFVNILMNLPVS